jgi:hypothetical protein
MTAKIYNNKKKLIFDFIGLQGLIEEGAKAFAERGKKDLDWMFVNILRFAQVQKERRKREIQARRHSETASKQSGCSVR